MPKKKKFIDKKNAVTFHLVHRSQQDPLQADEEASKGVLVHSTDKEKADARREELQKFGVYYDDDYNYLQHLRDVKELSQVEPMEVYRVEPTKPNKKPEIMLPSSVFESAVETKVGLLNKAVAVTGPQPSWDPDIVEALDEDFDFDNPDNQLDDDFISKAMADGPVKDGDDDDSEYEDSEDGSFASDEADMMGSDEDDFFDEYTKDPYANEETRSRFTSYSMTSSAVPRSEGLTLVDDRFEKLYEEYDDNEIGALDEDEIEGYVDHSKELLNSVLEAYERDKKQSQIKLKDFTGPCGHIDLLEDEGTNEDLIRMEVEEKPNKSQWDCESILSTYSTLYNHPKLIDEPKKTKPIKLTKRLGIPEDVLPERGPTIKQREEGRETVEHVPTYRPKDETVEEKKMRKKAVKEERKARREEKKATKQAFKEEEKKQQRELLNVRQALQGVQIH